MKKLFTLILLFLCALPLIAQNTDVTSITIPATDKIIGFNYFNQYPNLEEVIFEDTTSPIIIPDYPDSLSYSTSKGMFDDTLLKTIHIGRTFKDSYGNIITPFLHGSKTLEKVTFAASGHISLGQSFFADCIALENIHVPVNVDYKEHWQGEEYKEDVKGLFQGCVSLKSAILSTLDSYALGLNMFRGCKSLTYVSWRGSVDGISAGAFYGCESLVKELTPLLGIMWIGEYAFAECPAIEVLTIPSMVAIEKGAFMNCKNLKTLIFRNGPLTIKDEAFYGCDAIEDIFYFGSMPRINDSVFSPSVYETATLWRSTIPADGAWDKFVKRGKALSTNLPFIQISESYWNTKVTKPQQELEIKYEVHPMTMFDSIVEWTSSNPRVADFETIDDGVRVKALGKGETTIKAQLSNGNSASCNVKVFQPIDSICFNVNEVELEITKQQQLNVKFVPSNANNADMKNIRLASSNDSIATVDEKGTVNAVGIGDCEIIATTTDGSNLSATCKVNVIPIQVQSISIKEPSLRLSIGRNSQMNVRISPEDAYDQRIVWSSDDNEIAYVTEEGIVYAMGIGETVITATAPGGKNVSASCRVTVTPVWVEKIQIEPQISKIIKGDSIQLKATILPEDAENKNLTWSIWPENQNFAEISEDGLLKGLDYGNCVVRATAQDDSGVWARLEIRVASILVESIILEPSEWFGEPGDTIKLIPHILPENAHNKKIRWSSINNVASVDEDGLVTILREGEGWIIATSVENMYAKAKLKINSTSSAEKVIKDKPDRFDIYTPQGLCLHRSADESILSELAAGLYILRSPGSNRVIKKITITR